MNKFNVIVQLKKSQKAFQKEVFLADSREYKRFLSKINFFEFIEYVMKSCIIYPRSEDECMTCVNDLAYGFANNIGVGVFNLSDDEYEQLAGLVLLVADEIIAAMDSMGYYIHPSKYPKNISSDKEYDYVSDLTATSLVTKISNYTFRVEIVEGEYPEINEDLIQHSVYDAIIHYRSH